MHTHNILHRGLTIVALLTLLLPAASLPTTAASPSVNPAHPLFSIAPSRTRISRIKTDYSGGQSDDPLNLGHPLFSTTEGNASWEEVRAGSASSGGISDNSGSSLGPSVAIAPNSTPYVAWTDASSGDREIYVRRWNSTSWEEVGPSSASGGGISSNASSWSTDPWIAIAPDGTPYVAWNDDNSFHETGSPWRYNIYVRRWNGTSWEEVGPDSATGRGISDTDGMTEIPSLAIAPNGTPYVAWSDLSSGHWDIYVRCWNGSNWEEIGAGSASGRGIREEMAPSVAIAPDGTPYVAWFNWTSPSGGPGEIYVRRWNGSSWEEVGSGSATGGGISNNSGDSLSPSLAIAPDGKPYIA